MAYDPALAIRLSIPPDANNRIAELAPVPAARQAIWSAVLPASETAR
jgi:hypothetical protein